MPPPPFPFPNSRVDSLMGLVFGNILTGISMGWWKWNHNTHHNVCNSMNHDPDVQYLPLFSPNQSMLRSFYSSFHRRVFKADAVARVLTQYQHLLYYPVMMVARFNLYAQSFIFIHDTKVPTVSKPLELAGLAVFYTWLLTLLSSMPTWGQFFAYLLVSHATSAILHIQICLSHFPMPTYEGHPMQGTDEDSWWVLQGAWRVGCCVLCVVCCVLCVCCCVASRCPPPFFFSFSSFSRVPPLPSRHDDGH